MYLGKLGARAALATAGVLVSVALMAAPSWGAANGGNSANAKLCEPGAYPGRLFDQGGIPLERGGMCTSYAAKDNQIVGVNAVSGPVESGSFNVNFSAFGLQPGSDVFPCVRYVSGASLCVESQEPLKAAANGTFSVFGEGAPCEFEGEKLFFVTIQLTTASGIVFEVFFRAPC